MTSCFWADGPFEPTAVPSGAPICPRCGTPIAAVTSVGPTDHVATPCGCAVPGDVLE